MDDKRLLVAALLSLAVLILWQVLFPPPEPPVPPAPAGIEEATDEPIVAEEAEALAAPRREDPEEPAEAVIEEGVDEVAAVDSTPRELIEAAGEETLVVEGDGVRATFSNRGAQLISYELVEHDSAAGGLVDLVRRRDNGVYPFGLTGGKDETSPLNERLFAAERRADDRGREILEFRYSGPDGVATKSFLFRDDGLIDVEIEVAGDDRWGLVLGPGLRNPSARELEDRFARRSGVFLQGTDVSTVDSQGAEQATVVPGRGIAWVGLQDAYFLTVVMPVNPIESAVFLPVVVRVTDGVNGFERVTGELTGGDEDLNRELELLVYPGDELFRGTVFLGAKQYDRLSSLGHSLEETVSLGFFSFLARPLLWALLWIHDNLVSNYGWAIVLLTFLVRLVLFPLTHKSTVSMKKMQALNPQIQAIRSKYKPKLKDRKGRPNAEAQRKMNEEIMGLYKKEGVNPAGGCLPLLLQMPVLFAFYSLLSATVELRGAPWILWIKDLSAPDPIWVLPIVMGASQYLQQKMMPSTGDPTQRRIMMLMPAFFTVLFIGFPSGLVLYWLASNLFTIAQTALTNRFLYSDNDASAPAKGAAGKGSRKQ